jgi:DNA-binding CsgD family transcriptional regulator
MPDEARRVLVLYRGYALAEALASGLRPRGWAPQIAEQGRNDPDEDGQPIILGENDLGELPEPAVRTAARLARSGHWLIVVAGSAALADLVQAVAAGATAVNADQPFRPLLAAVHEVLQAGPAWPSQHERLLASLRVRADEARRFHALTARECAVLAAMAAGHSAESIAAMRPAGLSTVRSQIAAVLRKLGVRSQVAAIALTYRSCSDRRVTEPLARFHQNYG